MRNSTYWLFLIGAALIGFFVVLPIIGVILMILAAVLVVGLVIYLTAPLLIRLPWFRDRIFVHKRTYRQPEAESRRVDGDVIDVEGREIPDKE